MRATPRSVLALGALPVTAGCSAGATDPAPAFTTTRASVDRPTVAPAVSTTLDISAFIPHACPVLSATQRARLAMTMATTASGRKDDGACTWETASPYFRVAVRFTSTANPLAKDYERNKEPYGWAQFTPVAIGGQPAVLTTSTPDATCTASVATARDQGLVVVTAGDDRAVDWCGKAVAVATEVLRTVAVR